MKIFYSWQLDSPRKINKDFIKSALELAVENLKDSIVEDVKRDDIEIDQDTQGVMGAPDIANTILQKISDADVFLCDVSLVAKSKEIDDKAHLNSNVAIELGHAFGYGKSEQVIQVMNTHYGAPDQLPFDLRFRRHPLQYCLPHDAIKEKMEKEKRKLAKALAPILKQYYEKVDSVTSITTEFIPRNPTFCKGAFWEKGEEFIPIYSGLVTGQGAPKAVGCEIDRLVFLRFYPKENLPNLTRTDCQKLIYDNLRPMEPISGFTPTENNKYGRIVHSSSGQSNFEPVGFTQLFLNRELWGVNLLLLREKGRSIPSLDLTNELLKNIRHYRKFAKEKLKYADQFNVQIGMTGITEEDMIGVGGTYMNSTRGPIYETEIVTDIEVDSDVTNGEILRALLADLFDQVGLRELPENLRTICDNATDT